MSDPAGVDAAFRAAMAQAVGDGPATRLGVAVSGGPDSMALLDMATNAFPGRVMAATVDHGLRPESADEAAMVGRWCATRGVAHETLHPASRPDGNIQSWARSARYALLNDWRIRHGMDWLLTAHHADDQMETMLMRMNRGAGLSGLAGIRPRNGAIVRPLLDCRKGDLLDYAMARALPFVTDPSNADPRFDRAALRARLAQADWLDPRAAARSAAALSECDAALDWVVADLAARHVSRQGDAFRLDRTDLPRELLRRLLLHMLRRADSAVAPPRGDAVDRLIALALAGGKGSIGDWLLAGGPHGWTLSPAPPRRT